MINLTNEFASPCFRLSKDAYCKCGQNLRLLSKRLCKQKVLFHFFGYIDTQNIHDQESTKENVGGVVHACMHDDTLESKDTANLL